jgi:putative ABC transport system ATP-binding protein
MDHRNDGAPPLRVENVTKRFFQGSVAIEALRGVSLTVERGEFVAVTGASGSGKSTLLHVIAGLTRPDAGRVLIDNLDLAAMSDRQLTQLRRRRIGLVFQAFNLIPTLTAEQNILLPILSDGRAAADDGRLEDLIKSLGLGDRRRHRQDALSGGEQQRVAIARALVTNPSIILADEPTGSLDSVAGQDLCRLLHEQCRQHGLAIVVVTHEPAVATWADRVVILRDGCVLSEFRAADFHDAHALAAHYHEIVKSASATEAVR